MDTIVTPGLVLKETRYKESDRILTILTPELGVISASAQSSLRLKNKLFSACGLFCYSEFVLLPGRNMYTCLLYTSHTGSHQTDHQHAAHHNGDRGCLLYTSRCV